MINDADDLVAVLKSARAALCQRRSPLRKTSKVLETRQDARSSCATSTMQLGYPEAHRTKIQIPPIKLPEFDGDFKLWPAFWSCFKRAVEEQKFVISRKVDSFIVSP